MSSTVRLTAAQARALRLSGSGGLRPNGSRWAWIFPPAPGGRIKQVQGDTVRFLQNRRLLTLGQPSGIWRCVVLPSCNGRAWLDANP